MLHAHEAFSRLICRGSRRQGARDAEKIGAGRQGRKSRRGKQSGNGARLANAEFNNNGAIGL